MVMLFAKWMEKAEVNAFWVTQQCRDWYCWLTANRLHLFFFVEFVCSSCVCLGSFQGLQHPPTVQRLACEVSWDLYVGHWCECECECSYREWKDALILSSRRTRNRV